MKRDCPGLMLYLTPECFTKPVYVDLEVELDWGLWGLLNVTTLFAKAFKGETNST